MFLKEMGHRRIWAVKYAGLVRVGARVCIVFHGRTRLLSNMFMLSAEHEACRHVER